MASRTVTGLRGNSIPDGWRVLRLGEVGRFVNGRAFKPTEWGEIGLPIVRIQNLTTPNAPFNRFNGPANADNLINTGDIVVSWSATIEARTWVGGLAILNQHIFKAIERVGIIDRRFFFFLLVAAVDELRKRVHGTTMQHVTRGSFESLRVLLPPLQEQRAIAGVLDSIDEAIEKSEAVVAATENLRDALLHRLLTRGVPGWHSEWKEVRGIGPIPAGWNVARLGEVAQVLDSRRIPLNADERAKMPGKYPYYGANGVVDHINQWIFDEPDDLILLAEDGGHFDEFATRPIAYRVRGKCWVNNHAHVLMAKECIDVSFIFHSLVNKDIRPFINGTTRSKLTQFDLRSIKVGVPPLQEQQAIAQMLDGVDEAIERGRTETQMLQSLKASTANALLTGRVRTVGRT